MFSELLKKEIDLQVHASQRGVEREITEREIITIIDDPGTKVSMQANRRIRFENDGTTIIAENRGNSLRIITVYREV